MEQHEFNTLLKDLLGHLYDFVALEKHPLAGLLPVPNGTHESRGEYLRQVIHATIDKMQPAGMPFSLNALEWRPHTILHRRYVQGQSLADLADYLAISERQLRRDHGRAVQALAELLWSHWFKRPQPGHEPAESEVKSPQPFASSPETLDLNQVADSVVATMQRRAAAEAVTLAWAASSSTLPVRADRVILRQLLFGILNYAFHVQTSRLIEVKTSQSGQTAQAMVSLTVDEHWSPVSDEEYLELLHSAQRWASHIQAEVSVALPTPSQPGLLQLTVAMPTHADLVVLVVDDQQPTLRMYQRYLSRSALQIVGVHDPTQAVSTARQLHPALILLDVMMPMVDGWEILQSLQIDPQTNTIPVIVCSAWEASELAHSLGAVEFLKKPITQKNLLEAMERLHLPV